MNFTSSDHSESGSIKIPTQKQKQHHPSNPSNKSNIPQPTFTTLDPKTSTPQKKYKTPDNIITSQPFLEPKPKQNYPKETNQTPNPKHQRLNPTNPTPPFPTSSHRSTQMRRAQRHAPRRREGPQHGARSRRRVEGFEGEETGGQGGQSTKPLSLLVFVSLCCLCFWGRKRKGEEKKTSKMAWESVFF